MSANKFDPMAAAGDSIRVQIEVMQATIADLVKALGDIRRFSSAIERGEEPWREGVQEITRMALAALEKARQP